jgi:hypothetical protein
MACLLPLFLLRHGAADELGVPVPSFRAVKFPVTLPHRSYVPNSAGEDGTKTDTVEFPQ